MTRKEKVLNGWRLLSQTRSQKAGLFLVSAIVLAVSISCAAHAQSIAVTIETNASPRIEFGAQRVVDVLNGAGKKAWLARGAGEHSGRTVLIGIVHRGALLELENAGQLNLKSGKVGKEGFTITTRMLGGRVAVIGSDDSGALYGCLELEKCIRQTGDL
ncbi:MAG TPA: alpha-glucuronidase family glycosyl hydrolase, partial [Candidatus Paceibacterota bacterium]|nr:alpha-glucuronidase family glycosyl hydrolase [Candidatus Paceibacterota bacterium]